jgi:uncharacterized protein YbjT (DUF2867 family)
MATTGARSGVQKVFIVGASGKLGQYLVQHARGRAIRMTRPHRNLAVNH